VDCVVEALLSSSQASRVRVDGTKDGRRSSRKVYLHDDAFDLMQGLQRAQSGSPRFDLRDLTSAAIKVLLAANDPPVIQAVLKQARQDFADRHAKGEAA
jgi:hypothetical protein